MLLVRDDAGWTPPPSTDESVPVLNHRAAVLGFSITFTIIAWICSLLRLYTRLIVLKSPWWDDFFIVLVMLSNTTGSIIFCILPNYGQGSRHMDTLSVDEANEYIKVFYIGSVGYSISLAVIKLAVLFQYLRVFEVGSPRRTLCKVLIYFTFVWGALYAIPTWVPCYPVSDMWNVSNLSRRCWAFASPHISQAMGFYISQSVTTTLLDLIIFLLPIDLFFRPDTPKTTRTALLWLFALGLIVNFCSVGRLIYSLKPTLNALWDLSWNSPTPTGLADIEINLATVCAALPIFWPVLSERWGRILVTYEVKITSENGVYVPRGRKEQPPRLTSSQRSLTANEPFQPGEWDPSVRDTKTAWGDIETTVQSPAEMPVRVVSKEETPASP